MSAPDAWLFPVIAATGEPELEDLAGVILERLRGTVPEFFADPDVAYDMAAAVRANVRRFRTLLAEPPTDPGALTLPHEAADLLHSTLQHGIPLVALLEAYRGAQGLASGWWQQRVEQHVPPHQLPLARRHVDGLLVAYIDAAAAAVRDAYELERRALDTSSDGRRAHLIRRLLAGEPLDGAAAARTLNYPLDGRHVCLVLWQVGDGRGDELVTAREAVAAAIGATRSVSLATPHRLYAWLNGPGPLALREPVTLDPTVAAAASGEHRGLVGFTRAHHEAVRTADTIRGDTRVAGRVAWFDDFELVALLAQNRAASDRFVDRVLGPLARDQTKAGRQARRTLAIYLAAGGSATRAARELGVHRNTVMYRIAGLSCLEGHEDWAAFATRRLELELALRLVAQVGQAPA